MTPSLLWLQRLSRLEPAAYVALGGRTVQALTGLGTLYFVVRYLTPNEQGYYQTFLSLVALQSFLELGILIAVVSVISHEWAGLSRGTDGRVAGDAGKIARMATATRLIAWWFAGAAALFLLVGGMAGYLVLLQQGNRPYWLAPWVAVIMLAAASLWLQGLIAMMEGTGAVMSVALYRLGAGLVSALSLWAAAALGAGIWALAVQLACALACALVFLSRWHGRFIAGLVRLRAASTFNWWVDVWPMQWPLALQGATSYFYFSLFGPVLFVAAGAVEAGRMGLTLQVVLAMLSLAGALLAVRLPQLGASYASGDRDRFGAIWRQTTFVSVTITVALAGAVAAAAWSANAFGLSPSARFLDPLALTLLLLWGVGLNAVQCIALYWRAQRREPVGWFGALPGLATGLAVWWGGSAYGSLGASAGALTAFCLVTVPIAVIFFNRSRLHSRTHAVRSASGLGT